MAQLLLLGVSMKSKAWALLVVLATSAAGCAADPDASDEEAGAASAMREGQSSPVGDITGILVAVPRTGAAWSYSSGTSPIPPELERIENVTVEIQCPNAKAVTGKVTREDRGRYNMSVPLDKVLRKGKCKLRLFSADRTLKSQPVTVILFDRVIGRQGGASSTADYDLAVDPKTLAIDDRNLIKFEGDPERAP
jgi:hypothetical protein